MEFSVGVLKTKNLSVVGPKYDIGTMMTLCFEHFLARNLSLATEAATDFLEGSLRSDGSLAFVQFDSG